MFRDKECSSKRGAFDISTVDYHCVLYCVIRYFCPCIFPYNYQETLCYEITTEAIQGEAKQWKSRYLQGFKGFHIRAYKNI